VSKQVWAAQWKNLAARVERSTIVETRRSPQLEHCRAWSLPEGERTVPDSSDLADRDEFRKMPTAPPLSKAPTHRVRTLAAYRRAGIGDADHCECVPIQENGSADNPADEPKRF
jgi:hypothetical protein